VADTAPVSAEDLRERLTAVIKSVRIHPKLDSAVTAVITAGAGFHITDEEATPLTDAVLAALASAPSWNGYGPSSTTSSKTPTQQADDP
jgi:hypothetical protein